VNASTSATATSLIRPLPLTPTRSKRLLSHVVVHDCYADVVMTRSASNPPRRRRPQNESPHRDVTYLPRHVAHAHSVCASAAKIRSVRHVASSTATCDGTDNASASKAPAAASGIVEDHRRLSAFACIMSQRHHLLPALHQNPVNALDRTPSSATSTSTTSPWPANYPQLLRHPKGLEESHPKRSPHRPRPLRQTKRRSPDPTPKTSPSKTSTNRPTNSFIEDHSENIPAYSWTELPPH